MDRFFDSIQMGTVTQFVLVGEPRALQPLLEKNNMFFGTTTVLPITYKTVKKTYPFEVVLHIRTLDKRRLIKTIGRLSEEDMFSVEKAVKIHLDLT